MRRERESEKDAGESSAGFNPYYVAGALVIVALALWYVGSRDAPAQAPFALAIPQATALPPQASYAPSATPSIAAGAADGGDVLVLEAPAPADPEDDLAAASCGDSVCDASERCDTCFADCGCPAGYSCSQVSGACVEAAG